MRRRTVRPFGSSMPASRAMSMLIGLAVLWVVYDAIRQPAAWHWLSANDDDRVAQAPVVPAAGQAAESLDENVSPGPNDLDPEALQTFQEYAELITDKTELRSREMIAYWQLLDWSRTQPFAEFEQRARQEPALTQIWEEPQKHRGKPIRLRLHVRRVLEWETEKNPMGVPKVYEAMGWTDESKSLPYTVVFTEKPLGLPVGNEVEAEVVFVGYFLKILTYSAFDDTKRGTPLMMGRVRVIAPRRKAAVAASRWEIAGLALGGLLLIPVGFWFVAQGRRHKPLAVVPPSALDPQWVPFQDAAPVPLTDFDPTRVGSPVEEAHANHT